MTRKEISATVFANSEWPQLQLPNAYAAIVRTQDFGLARIELLATVSKGLSRLSAVSVMLVCVPMWFFAYFMPTVGASCVFRWQIYLLGDLLFFQAAVLSPTSNKAGMEIFL